MSPRPRFVLNFSGTGMLEKTANATKRLRGLAADEHTSRARLCAIIAASSVFTDREVALEAAKDAARAANEIDDEVAYAWALLAQCIVNLSCEATARRLTMSAEILNIAARTEDTEFVDCAYFLHLAALAELGQMDDLDQALSPVGPLITRFPWLENGRHVTWFRCLQSTLDGQATRAEELAHTGLTIAQASDDPDAQTVWIGQLGVIRWMQGRVTELEPAFLQARQSAPHEPVWAASLAWMWLEQGRRSAARALVSTFPPVPQMTVDRNWLSTTCILAEVTSELGDRRRAQELQSALLPFADRVVTIGLGVTCWGVVARSLALTAVALGDRELAVAHYRKAMEVAGRVGAHPWLAEIQWELAELLGQTGRKPDLEEALVLAEEAVATGRAVYLHRIEQEASRVLEALRRSAAGEQTLETGGEDENVGHPQLTEVDVELASRMRPRITVLGGFAVTGVDGSVATWQSRKARTLLKILVARRGAVVGRESLMDLLWPGESPHRLSNRFSVALTAVRRALDPASARDRNAFVEVRDGLVRLRTDAVDVDAEQFLQQADALVTAVDTKEDQMEQLARTLALYVGEPMPDDQGELWAAEYLREVHLSFFAATHKLAAMHANSGDDVARIPLYRQVLALDKYDYGAHEGLVEALMRLGAHGQARVAREEYARQMGQLGVEVRPA